MGADDIEMEDLRKMESQRSLEARMVRQDFADSNWRRSYDELDPEAAVVPEASMKTPLTRWDTKGKALDARSKAQILKKTVLVKSKVLKSISENQRSTFYRSILKYIVFMTLLMYVFWWTPRDLVFKNNDAISEVFVREEIPGLPIHKDFFDIDTRDEFWQWVRGPLLSGFYGERPILLHQVPIGGVRIRQVRVRPEECESALTDSPTLCYPEWSEATEDKRDFLGLEYQDGLSRLYPSIWDTYEVFFRRHFASRGGYVVDLPADFALAASDTVDGLIADDFIDQGTRFVTISFNLWNHNTRMLSVAQFVFTFTSTGRIDKMPRIDGILLVSLDTYGQQALFAVWILVFINCAFYLCQFLVKAYRKPTHALRSMLDSSWQLVELIWRILIGVFLYYSLHFMYESFSVRNDLTSVYAARRFEDYESFRQLYVTLNDVIATTGFWSFTKILKYLRLNNRMNQLWKTISMASKELVAFLLLFFIIFTAYAIAGHILFGDQLVLFYNLRNSYLTCFQMLVGSMEDFQLMMAARPRVAPLFVYSFMSLVYLVILNMFLAILNDFHSLTMDSARRRQADKEAANTVQYDPLVRVSDLYTSLLLLTVHVSKSLRRSKRGLVVDANEVFYLVPFLDERTPTPFEVGSNNKFLVVYSPTGHHVRVMSELLAPGDKLYINRTHCIEVLEPLSKDGCAMKVRFVSFYTDYATIYGGEELRAPSWSFFKYLGLRAREKVRTQQRIFARKSNLVRRQICNDQDLREIFAWDESVDPVTVDGFSNPEAFLNFDELVRRVRKICENEQFRTGIVYVEREIIDEVLSYFDRYRDAQQVLYSGNFLPKPFPTDTLRLPDGISELLPYLARRIHNTWAAARFKSGYVLGEGNEDKTSPYLVPFHKLPDTVKESNLLTVEHAIRGILYLGYRIEGDLDGDKIESADEAAAADDKEWKPSEEEFSGTEIDGKELNRLLDLLAADSHDVWAMHKMKQGYVYGTARNEDLKTHPGIIPFWDLDDEEKEYDLVVNRVLIKAILAKGLHIRPPTRHRETSMQTLIEYLQE